MLNFKEFPDKILTDLWGKNLLTTPQLNKGTAFTADERKTFGLLGKLPFRIESLEEQVVRAYLQFSRYKTDMQKHIYLNNLHDKNQILFYKLVTDHLVEMVPLIYTPCIGKSVQEFNHEFRQARGLFINYEDRDHIDEILDNRTNPDIDLIVMTDGEGVLGIGDQGVGSINIPIGKLMLYTLCAGISPLRTLPIYLDLGTNNQTLLNDPFYLGARHERIRGRECDNFIIRVVAAIQRKFPLAFLHWEDFGRDNARRILEQYQHQTCTFNDDIQGTGAVTLSAILAAVKQSGSDLTQQRVIVFGAGTAGTGIADQVYQSMLRQGLSPPEAREKFWLLDRPGLLTTECNELTSAQIPYARNATEVAGWQRNAENKIDLLETVKQTQPTILIGSSAQTGAFNEVVIKTMSKYVNQPIILALSNPTERAEAVPQDLINWTNGNALIATGSPFDPVEFKGKTYSIAQCNNALVYPGIGLGVLATRAKLLTDDMLWEACQALSDFSGDALLPPIAQARETAFAVAVAVAKQAIKENLQRIDITGNITMHIKNLMWQPKYVPLQLIETD
jgi:malate dehydrogenase (oxaloacetate-decarboxylating)